MLNKERNKRNRKNSGITLIALIITIIVLLILAGVTISAISGNEGVLDKAKSAKSKTDIANAKEAAALKISDYFHNFYQEKYIDNNTSANTVGEYINEQFSSQVQSGNYYMQKDATTGKLKVSSNSDGTNVIVSGTIGSNGKIEWDDSIDGGGTPTGPTSWLAKDILTLPEDPNDNTKLISPYVNYTLNGQTTPTLCRVLYNDGTNVELITVNSVAKVKLGWSDPTVTQEEVEVEKTRLPSNLIGYKHSIDTDVSYELTPDEYATAKVSYNNVVGNLNTKARGYMNTNLSSDARCVGTNPSNPYEDNPGSFSETTPEYLTTCKLNDGSYKNTDTNPNYDLAQLRKISAFQIESEDCGWHYWFASRRAYVDKSSNYTYFAVRAVSMTGSIRSLDLLRVYASGQTSIDEYENGLRPVFKLKSTVKVVNDGADGSEEHPYNLE